MPERLALGKVTPGFVEPDEGTIEIGGRDMSFVHPLYGFDGRGEEPAQVCVRGRHRLDHALDRAARDLGASRVVEEDDRASVLGSVEPWKLAPDPLDVIRHE